MKNSNLNDLDKTSLIDKLTIAYKELFLQNEEKIKRAEELFNAYKEIDFQNAEKAKRAAELLIANKELIFQNEEKARRAEELVSLNEKLKISLLETVGLARALCEMRDLYTAGHEQNVGNLAEAISAELGFDASRQEGMRVTGYLHDIGKIVIPIEILVKPSRLTLQEFELVKNHVIAGYNAIKDISFPWPLARAVLEHHERLDGSGYPKGLKGDEISMEGRILAIADIYDAMTSHRPYRPGLGTDMALEELKLGSGKIYDKTVVEACVFLIKDKGYTLTHKLGYM